MDCGRVTLGEQVRYFDNIASLGISGEIARHLKSTVKVVLSAITGLFKSARAYAKSFSIDYLNPNQDWQHYELPDAFVTVVANAQYFGGGMHIAPKAMMNDGLFHCVLVKSVSALEIMRYLRFDLQWKTLKTPTISRFSCF